MRHTGSYHCIAELELGHLHCRTGAWSSVSMRAKHNLAVSFLVFMLQVEDG